MIRRCALAMFVAALSLAACRKSEPPPTSPVARLGFVSKVALKTYRVIADEMETHLTKGILDNWYPRIVDKGHGGFGPHVNYDWSFQKDNSKFLVFQSRMTWVPAEVALRFPARREQYLAFAEHGLSFLENVMWDRGRRLLLRGRRERQADHHREARLRCLFRDVRERHDCAGNQKPTRAGTGDESIRLAREARARFGEPRLLRGPFTRRHAHHESAGARFAESRRRAQGSDRDRLRSQVDEHPHPSARVAHRAAPCGRQRAGRKSVYSKCSSWCATASSTKTAF